MAINQTETLRMLKVVATTLRDADSNADYEASSTADMTPAVKAIIQHFKLSRTDVKDFVQLRHIFEKAITKQYRVKYKYTSDELAGVLMRKSKVPQVTRIMSGMLDLTIAELNIVRIDMRDFYKEAV